MGYYSDVVIQCATKAFGIIKEAYEGVGVKPSKMLVDPCDKSKTIRFDWIKWDACIYDDIATIEKAILSLNDEKYAGDEDYAYKIVIRLLIF